MPIEQRISPVRTLSRAPDTRVDDPEQFDIVAYDYTASQKNVNDDMQVLPGQLNTFAEQANDLKEEVNDLRDAALLAKEIAETARDEAVGAVATLPDGIINNSTVSETNTWSSSKIDSTKLSLSGGTMTGAINDTVVDKGTISTGTVTFMASAGNVQKLTVGGALTIALNGWVTTGNDQFLKIILVNGGSSSVTLPSINWVLPDGTKTNNFATYLTAIRRTSFQTTGIDFILLMSSDGGTTVYGKLA